ncbi:thioredoxin reductase-like protein [Ordospora colligata]|uniref:Thioredoxin reductase-like protein n=1 Tax=Ordospora colligata OC4 TaxID=1354746 RepID=A0A0B2UMA8_9MICR|nr:thioredoxin reductase-like protein [Ordospora colligata OC4]KHN70404.1 thioredoxin reductase-like protein [Ordospora colligata OC4]TBU17154.1 thioredoxin reductase-like protein [Ordospora colligata]TBU17404.1 thioredoxin reductase-like protein [Ordospora colligata]TBU19584.1 thioredoxin reductase-like protein [Ordospora colligata]
MKNVVIVGQGPASYMCGIYIHTANLSPMIIKDSIQQAQSFIGFDKVAGVDGVGAPDEFTNLLEKQARNMGIDVVNDSITCISRANDVFTVVTSNASYKSKSLVIDSACLEKKYRAALGETGVFYTSDKITHNEAIIMAGAGCKVSFDVKEFIEADTSK